jgi:hypothetical protein
VSITICAIPAPRLLRHGRCSSVGAELAGWLSDPYAGAKRFTGFSVVTTRWDMTGWKGRRAETDVTGCESGGAGQGRGVGCGTSGTLLAVAGSVALVLVDWRLWLAQSTSGGRRWQAES